MKDDRKRQASETAALAGGGLAGLGAYQPVYKRRAIADVNQRRVFLSQQRFANHVKTSSWAVPWVSNPQGPYRTEIAGSKTYRVPAAPRVTGAKGKRVAHYDGVGSGAAPAYRFDQVHFRDAKNQVVGGFGAAINPRGQAHVGGISGTMLWNKADRAGLNMRRQLGEYAEKAGVKEFAGVRQKLAEQSRLAPLAHAMGRGVERAERGIAEAASPLTRGAWNVARNAMLRVATPIAKELYRHASTATGLNGRETHSPIDLAEVYHSKLQPWACLLYTSPSPRD